MSNGLPRGWAKASVSEIVEHMQPGFACGEKNVEGGVPHLRMNNIGIEGRLVLNLVRTVPEKLSKSHHDLCPGDVLVCTTNSSKLVGKCALFNLPGRYVFSNHLTRLRPKLDLVDSYFLLWSLWLRWQAGTFEDKCKHWVNQSTLPKEGLLETDVALAPINEQHRIVAKLEKLLGKVDGCQQRLTKIPVILKRFRQSVLAAACSGRLTADWRQEKGIELEGWTEALLRDVAEMRLGKMLDNAKNIGNPTRYLRNLNVRWFSFDLSNVGTMRATSEERNELEIKDGDLLVCEGGEPGRCGVWNFGVSDLIFQKAIHRIRVKEMVNSYWLAFNIRNDANSAHLEDYFTGTTIKHLTGKALATYRFPLPSVSEQSEIVRRVEALFGLADQIEARFTKARARVNQLTQAILAKAFRGELVFQNPNDEPASVLLERIKAERMKGETEGKGGGKKRLNVNRKSKGR